MTKTFKKAEKLALLKDMFIDNMLSDDKEAMQKLIDCLSGECLTKAFNSITAYAPEELDKALELEGIEINEE